MNVDKYIWIHIDALYILNEYEYKKNANKYIYIHHTNEYIWKK